MTGEARIRPARPADLPAVLALLEGAALPRDGVAEWFAHFHVAEHEGRLVGAAGLELYGPDALLRSVVVAPAWRGRGLGAVLVDRALHQAAVAGVRAVYLLTTTATEYFPRFGFRPVTRDAVPAAVQGSVEFRDACPASAAALVKELDAALSPPAVPRPPSTADTPAGNRDRSAARARTRGEARG